MRRLQILMSAMLAVGLVAAPTIAPAAPPTTERFEWSTSAEHGRLGVMVIGLTPELRAFFGAAGDRGVLIARVAPDSAAARAGLRVGDVLVEVHGAPIEDALDVLAALDTTRADAVVPVAVVRDHRRLTLQARIDRRTQSEATPPVGPGGIEWLRRLLDRMAPPPLPGPTPDPAAPEPAPTTRT